MNFIPLGDRILVKRVEEENTTASGIYIPDNAKEKPSNGAVVAISSTVKDDNEIEVGDKVMFAKYSGTEIKIDNEEYLVMNIDDIFGIIK